MQHSLGCTDGDPVPRPQLSDHARVTRVQPAGQQEHATVLSPVSLSETRVGVRRVTSCVCDLAVRCACAVVSVT